MSWACLWMFLWKCPASRRASLRATFTGAIFPFLPSTMYCWGALTFRAGSCSTGLRRVAMASIGFRARASQSGYGLDWFPGVDVSYWLLPELKWMASYNHSLRLPTFTDLFYSGPTNQGNPNLQPEEARTVETSFRWRPRTADVQLGGFYRVGKNMIDWGRQPGEDKYTTSNINRVEAFGLELAAQVDLRGWWSKGPLQDLRATYAYVWQDLEARDGYESYYVLDHLRNKLNVSLAHRSEER